MRTQASIILVLLIAVASLAGCAGTQKAGSEQERTTVLVDNQHEDAVVVYAVRSGQRRRLGRVSAFREEELELPPTIVSRNGTPLQFLIDYLGVQRPPVTREIAVYPGDQVELTIPS